MVLCLREGRAVSEAIFRVWCGLRESTTLKSLGAINYATHDPLGPNGFGGLDVNSFVFYRCGI